MPYPPTVDRVDVSLQTLLNGQRYRSHFQQTIGSSAQGFYGMALYNPANSGKTIHITAVRGWVNGNAPLMYAFKSTSDPAMGNAATSANGKINNDDLSVSTASVVTVTYNTASGGVSFPGTTNIASIAKPTNDTAVFQKEGSAFLRMPVGVALSLEVIMFVANSAQYGIEFEWDEF